MTGTTWTLAKLLIVALLGAVTVGLVAAIASDDGGGASDQHHPQRRRGTPQNVERVRRKRRRTPQLRTTTHPNRKEQPPINQTTHSMKGTPTMTTKTTPTQPNRPRLLTRFRAAIRRAPVLLGVLPGLMIGLMAAGGAIWAAAVLVSPTSLELRIADDDIGAHLEVREGSSVTDSEWSTTSATLDRDNPAIQVRVITASNVVTTKTLNLACSWEVTGWVPTENSGALTGNCSTDGGRDITVTSGTNSGASAKWVFDNIPADQSDATNNDVTITISGSWS